MMFINKKPKQPGFYWVKRREHIQIVKLIQGPNELELLVHGSKIHFPLSVVIKSLQWAGPLEIPGEVDNNNPKNKGA